LIPDTIHSTKQYGNNRAEKSHETIRVREQGYASSKQSRRLRAAEPAMASRYRREKGKLMTQWRVGKYFIREKGRCLGHPAGATAEAEPSFLTRKCHETLAVALIATYPQEPVFETTAFVVPASNWPVHTWVRGTKYARIIP
jgi:hypothetical protein